MSLSKDTDITETVKLKIKEVLPSMQWTKIEIISFKVSKAISTSERESKSMKMCGINIHLTIHPFTFNKYFISKLLYMIVINYQNKTLYNKVLFDTYLMALVMFSRIHRTNPMFNNKNKVDWYDTKHTVISYFAIYQSVRYSCISYHWSAVSTQCNHIKKVYSVQENN